MTKKPTAIAIALLLDELRYASGLSAVFALFTAASWIGALRFTTSEQEKKVTGI